MRICVIGLGYIGLPTAAMLAVNGHEVIGVDVNPWIVEELRAGRPHIQEPGLSAVVQATLSTKSLQVASGPGTADAFIIAVPTPLRGGHAGTSETPMADLSFVRLATESIVPVLESGDLVILESTSPPGTSERVVRPLLETTGLVAGDDFHLAYCAERVLPGRIMVELVENDRVVGGVTPESAEAAKHLYSSFVTGEIHVTDSATAEMVKLMENTFRDVNIALANEFSRIAQTQGVDVSEAIALANRHPRVNILQPGPGVGGHCIAVDPWFLVDVAPDVSPLIRTAREVNDRQPYVTAELVGAATADLADPVVTLLGLTYKADSDDLRDSPALRVAGILTERGYTLRIHDPYVTQSPAGLSTTAGIDEALQGSDLMVVLTDHTEYRGLRPEARAAAGMRTKRVLDMRCCLDHAAWRAAGFEVQTLRWPRSSPDVLLVGQ
ncbi:MAG TPA: nucleotide sugar dehydrogenase [Chloroflexota bacterium]|nr:nucleotide sugar dehydrogenase [Chloroflexota bacterium]